MSITIIYRYSWLEKNLHDVEIVHNNSFAGRLYSYTYLKAFLIPLHSWTWAANAYIMFVFGISLCINVIRWLVQRFSPRFPIFFFTIIYRYSWLEKKLYDVEIVHNNSFATRLYWYTYLKAFLIPLHSWTWAANAYIMFVFGISLCINAIRRLVQRFIPRSPMSITIIYRYSWLEKNLHDVEIVHNNSFAARLYCYTYLKAFLIPLHSRTVGRECLYYVCVRNFTLYQCDQTTRTAFYSPISNVYYYHLSV